MFAYEDKTPHWVNRLSFVLRTEVQRRFKAAGYDLTAEEWAMLMLLWGREPRSVSDIAASSLRERTTVTRLLDGMVAKGLVERRPGADDARRVDVGLTEAARALQAPLVGLVEEMIGQATAGLTRDEVAVANKVLRTMTENLVEAAGGAAGRPAKRKV